MIKQLLTATLAVAVAAFAVQSVNAASFTVLPVFGGGFNPDFSPNPGFDPNGSEPGIVQVDFLLQFDGMGDAPTFGAVVFNAETAGGVMPEPSFPTYTALPVLGADPPGPPPAPELLATNADLGDGTDLIDITVGVGAGDLSAETAAVGTGAGTLVGQIFVAFDGTSGTVSTSLSEAGINNAGVLEVLQDAVLIGGTLELGATVIPEPTSAGLVCLALAGVAGLRRRS